MEAADRAFRCAQNRRNVATRPLKVFLLGGICAIVLRTSDALCHHYTGSQLLEVPHARHPVERIGEVQGQRGPA